MQTLQNRSRSDHGLRPRSSAMSEINVTPFVDVMLVLLIIFMVTAPLMTVGVPVNLPEVEASSINEKTEPLVVTVTPKGDIFIQETEIAFDALGPRLKAITAENTKTRIFIRGDRNLNYGTMMQVMGVVTASGFDKVALLTEMPDGTKTSGKASKLS